MIGNVSTNVTLVGVVARLSQHLAGHIRLQDHHII